MSSVSAYGSFGSVYYVGSRGVGLGGDGSSFASVCDPDLCTVF